MIPETGTEEELKQALITTLEDSPDYWEWLFRHWMDACYPRDVREQYWEIWQARAWRRHGGCAV